MFAPLMKEKVYSFSMSATNVEQQSKFLPQIAPEAVSEHENTKKISGEACP